jgi:effector-binding domain-containing protein
MEQTFVSDRSSGRNVMIACVTDEVAMVTKPATFYHIDRIHLLNYVTPDEYQDSESKKARATMYKTVYDEVCKRMDSLGITVMPSLGNIPTYRFDHMLEAVYRIIKMESEKDEDAIIYVNISSGTKEFAAAASVASMMFGNTRPFSVFSGSSDEGPEYYEKVIESMRNERGELVGRTKNVRDEPMEIKRIPIQEPNTNLLRSLKVLDSIPVNSRTNTKVIRALMANDLWVFDTKDPERKTTEKLVALGVSTVEPEYKAVRNVENVTYQRRYIDRWIEEGWIRKQTGGTGKAWYVLTPIGEMYINTFCSDAVYSPRV